MTLVEMLVALGISGILFTAVGGLMFYSGRSFAALTNYVDLDNYSRGALDRMTREIRQANRLISYSSTRLDFEDFDGATVSYVFNPTAETLSRIKGGESQLLLKECEFLNFSIFQRNPIGGTYDQYATANPATTKLIQLSWICSRDILGSRANTESVQSAKVVIRKQ